MFLNIVICPRYTTSFVPKYVIKRGEQTCKPKKLIWFPFISIFDKKFKNKFRPWYTYTKVSAEFIRFIRNQIIFEAFFLS